MGGWTETDSSTYAEIADIAVPRRAEMMDRIVAAVPFACNEPFGIVEIGCGEGRLAAALLERFPQATITAFDGSAVMRERAGALLAPFGRRARVRAFKLETLEWWDQMFGADLVVSSLCVHHLNDAKKQYLYKGVADRVSARGALVIADIVDPSHESARHTAADQWDAAAAEQAQALGRPDLLARFHHVRWNHFRFPDPEDHPSPIFRHLVWLRHAGFGAVDCLWLFAGHAVFAGFNSLKEASLKAEAQRPQG